MKFFTPRLLKAKIEQHFFSTFLKKTSKNQAI